MCAQTSLRCLASFTITTWHDIHAAMRTLPMAMNPNNIFRPPARWALWLQNWLWLGLICCCCLIWHLLIYLRLFNLGQLSHPALGWCSGVGSNDPAKCRLMQDQTQPNPNLLIKTRANADLTDGQRTASKSWPTNDGKKFWHPVGDSNPCCRRERAVS